jgi:hypothetical protein
MKLNREILDEMGYTDSIIFTNPDYDDAIIGVSHDDRVIYDYDKMLEHLMVHEDMTDEEAADFISYNTIRSIPYAGENAPIVMFGL